MCAYGLQARKHTVLCKRSQPGLLSLYFANMKHVLYFLSGPE